MQECLLQLVLIRVAQLANTLLVPQMCAHTICYMHVHSLHTCTVTCTVTCTEWIKLSHWMYTTCTRVLHTCTRKHTKNTQIHCIHCTCTNMYIHTHACTNTHGTHTHACTHKHTHTCMHPCQLTCTHMHPTHACMHTQHTCTHTHTSILWALYKQRKLCKNLW